MSEDAKGAWAVIGKIAVVVGVLVGLVTLYNFFVAKEVSVEAEGTCRQLALPDSLLQPLKENVFPTADEIEKVLPEKLADKKIIALDIASSNRNGASKLSEAVRNLKDLHSVCSFTVTNTGNKEAQEINLELPREGVYFVEKLGESPQEATFKKIIPIGKLNPGGRIKVATWNKDYSSTVTPWERSDFRITHTSGISEVNFLPDNTTSFGWLYETYPTATFVSFMGLMIIVG